jgi:hypothetical protein
MATQQRQAAIYDEGRLALAYQDYHNGQFQTLHAAAIRYDIDPKKLNRRIASIEPRVGSIARNRLLTLYVEQTLVQWILLMDKWGMPPRLQAVR